MQKYIEYSFTEGEVKQALVTYFKLPVCPSDAELDEADEGYYIELKVVNDE